MLLIFVTVCDDLVVTFCHHEREDLGEGVHGA